jgi:beta-fructofuranosidase
VSGLDRPRIHLTPPIGWLNDPNGMAVRDGRWHVFYQYEPDAPRWGRMRWGHASSTDLLRWEHHPVALEPRDHGPDRSGCWSGCLVPGADPPTILYTGVAARGGIRHASIMAAIGSPDLMTWTREPAGPVIAGAPAGIRPDMFRDPFIWRDDDGWAMLVGAGTSDRQGTVLLYRSADLRTWTYHGPLLTTLDIVRACPDLDVSEVDGPCWECPQLVRLPDHDLLIMSVVDRSPTVRPAHVIAVTGRMHGDRFVVQRASRLGLGPDFYAPSTTVMPDGRALLFGWIPEDPPPRGSRRAWAGCLTLPRTVSVDADGRPRITLATETDDLGDVVRRWPSVTVSDDTPWLVGSDSGHVDLRFRMRPDGAVPVRIDLSTAAGLAAEIRYDPRTRRFGVARIGWVTVAGRDPHGSTVLPAGSAELEMRIILDGSVMELVCDGWITATVRLPSIGDGGRTFELSTLGGACQISDAELRSF